jgi:GT2 family glycosyltransferase
MTLSIVILNYNTRDFLLPCLKGIIEHTRDLDYEIIIVDNASTDGSADYVSQKLIPRFSQIKLVAAKANRGYAAGNNLGILTASGQYLVIMNPDIVIRDNALKKMVDFMQAHPAVGMAGPRLSSPDGALQYFCYRFPTPLVLFYRRLPLYQWRFARRAVRQYLMADWNHRANRPVDWLQGSCLIVRRASVDKVGLMDERFFLYFEDTDWCRRFWQAGFEVWYLADVEIVHYHSRASANERFYRTLFNKMSWIHLASTWKYFWKWRMGKLKG